MMDCHRYLGRKGVSMIEMLMVVGVIGLVALFVFPSVVRIFDHIQVRGARTVVINNFNSARTAARISNRMTELKLSGNQIWIERYKAVGKDTLGTMTNLSTEYGVLISGPSSIRIDPRGMLETSGTAKFVLSRGGWSDSVMISNYGKVSR